MGWLFSALGRGAAMTGPCLYRCEGTQYPHATAYRATVTALNHHCPKKVYPFPTVFPFNLGVRPLAEWGSIYSASPPLALDNHFAAMPFHVPEAAHGAQWA